MKKANLSATDVIRRDHRAAEELMKKYKNAQNGDRESLARKIFEALEAHEKMEDDHFYPALKGELKDDDEYEQLVEEQEELNEQVKHVKDADDRLERLLPMLQHVMTHAKKEETELLPMAEDALGSEKLLKLGEKMEPDSAVGRENREKEKAKNGT